MDEVPDLTTDEEEQAFWATHSLGDGIKLKTRDTSDHPLPPPRAQTSQTERISLMLEQDTVKRLKRLAKHKGIGYQTLLKTFVSERLYEEEKREGVLPSSSSAL